MNEIQVVVDQQPGRIRFNYDDIETMLREKLAFYKGAVVTEEGKTAAKKEVAYLRKLKKEIDDRRKAVKREWNQPFDEFNAKVMALMSMIDEPILLIDEQVKAFDEKQRQEKKEKIRDLYEELVGEAREYLSFERAYVPSWENVSTSMKKVREELQAKIDTVNKDILTISSMQSEAVPKALEIYKKSLDAMEAVRHINQYEQQKQEILRREQQRQAEEEERRRQAEIERIRAEERKRIAEEERIRREAEEKAAAEERARIEAEQATREQVAIAQETAEAEEGFQISEADDGDEFPFEQPSTKTVFYKVVATPEELEQVEMAFNSLGIYFSRRDEE